jgi:hypothetical protein
MDAISSRGVEIFMSEYWIKCENVVVRYVFVIQSVNELLNKKRDFME